jgi:hypothetical protein
MFWNVLSEQDIMDFWCPDNTATWVCPRDMSRDISWTCLGQDNSMTDIKKIRHVMRGHFQLSRSVTGRPWHFRWLCWIDGAETQGFRCMRVGVERIQWDSCWCLAHQSNFILPYGSNKQHCMDKEEFHWLFGIVWGWFLAKLGSKFCDGSQLSAQFPWPPTATGT